MEDLSSTTVSWLLNKEAQNKASVLHRIKRLECDLTSATQVGAGIQSAECLEICEKLLASYRLYIKFFKSASIEPPWICFEFQTVEQIYEQIACFQQQMTLSTLDAERAAVIHQLIGLYEQFKNKLNAASSEPIIQNKVEQPLQRLMQADKPEQWLSYLVQWLNVHQANSIGKLSSAFQDFLQVEMNCWAHIFSDPAFLKLFSSIYYYKLFPEKLFSQNINSEKLISIRQRLTRLYHFIEQVQQLYYKQAESIQITPVNDLLLHEEELPDGVEPHVETSLQPVILNALKEWKVHVNDMDDEAYILEHLFDLLRAYKFWFNPERLVDALMVLQEKLNCQCITDNFDRQHYKHAMIKLFASFKTSDCLDLYGYFSNKDSRYLLRLIHHLLHGGEVEGIVVNQLIERQALLRVFESFYSTMEALREVLQKREIGTKPYSLDLERPLGQPGRRKCQAVQRIISLYAIEPMSKNSLLEELFQQAEKS